MLTFPRIIPTSRAVILLALSAPIALIAVGIAPDIWFAVPLLALVLLAMVLLDVALVGRLIDARVISGHRVEVGASMPLSVLADIKGGMPATVEAALALDARLSKNGRCDTVLQRDAATETWRGDQQLFPNRRGEANIDTLWLRLTGPLGLGARLYQRQLTQKVVISPNISSIRSPALQIFLRDAQIGLIARRIRGEGTQFEALAEYQPGMDRRRIDWKSSARHTHLYAKEYETERNNQIVFALDCGQAMCEPLAGMPRIDRAVSAALLTSYVALKNGDKVALFGFAARPDVITPFVSDTRYFNRLQSEASRIDYQPQEPNFTLALATLANTLKRRSMIVLFSDFTDPTSAELMIESIGRLVARHLVLFITLQDEELETLATAQPSELNAVAMATTAESLLQQKAMVTRRLRQLGVDVIEAPYDQIGMRLINAYLAIKRKGSIG